MATEEEKPAPAAPAKPGRGRPVDDQAPPKPKNAFQVVTGAARKKIKEENPALATDLKAMGDALKAAWDNTPESEKERLSKEYEAAMEIWRPKWAVYKETDHYKAFFEVKQDWMDLKNKKKLIKVHQKGKVIVGTMVRVKGDFEHTYPEGEEANNYKLKGGEKGTVVAVKSKEEGGHCEIEWSHGRKEYLKKHFGKLEDPDIPKRPKSGYMIFAGEHRAKANEEVIAAGGGMGDIGKKISDWWEQTSETKKAEYGERSSRMKEVFDKEFLIYKKTDKFKSFENTKVKLDASQKLKKLTRTTMSDAPKRPPSGFSLWKKDAMPKLMEDNKTNGISMSMGELGKKLGTMWQDVAQAEKDELAKKAAVLKTEWEAQHMNFKKKGKYLKFLEERQKVKIRENRLVNLRDMPKRPKSVFALYAAEHKNEVPQGKGEGKGTSALKQKFVSAPEDEKVKLARVAKEAEDAWKEELATFKSGDVFKFYTTTETKVKREFMNEAVKVMTIRFINAAPPAPPRSPFSVYIGEKRKAAGEGDEAPKSKEAKQDEVVKYKKEWDKLDRDVKSEYDAKRKEKIQIWEKDVRVFMEQAIWQEYLREARRLKLPLKQLLTDKKQIKKLKNGMMFVPLPDKPETAPQRPPNAYKLFVKEKKKEIDDPEKIVSTWKELDIDGKKKYFDEAQSLQQQFLQDMKEFRASDEGKLFFRTSSSVLRRRKIIKAKFDYLKELPKKPAGALSIFLEKNTKIEKVANAALKGFEIKKKLTDKWIAMTPEEKEPIEQEAKAKFDKFNEEMAAFKASENWMKYNRAVKTKPKGKAKKVVDTSVRAPKAPEEMPRSPTALSEFAKENPGMPAADLQAAFNELSEERKEELDTKVKEAAESYEEALMEFNKSEKGMLYQRALSHYAAKKKGLELRARLAKAVPPMPKKPAGIPEKPQGSFKLYCKSQAGTGKDLAALHRGFRELDTDEKGELESKAKEEEEKYKEDLAAFNNSEAGKKYTRGMAVYEKRKRLGEAKARFLGDMPKKPDIAFKFFINENREKVVRENPELKGLGAVMGKLSAMYRSMSADEKKMYVEKENEAKEEYQRKMQEFQNGGEYKKFKAIESRVSGKAVGSAKAKAKSSGPPAPIPPADMPKKPPMAFFMFKTEATGSPKEVHQKWLDLKAEGQAEWNNKYKQAVADYDNDMKAFNKTAEGKKYNRLKSAYDQKQAEQKARQRYLSGSDVPTEPKRPMSAYFLFVNAKRDAVVRELGGGKFAEVSAKLTKLWQEATKEDKEEFDQQAKDAKEEYEKAMAEYRNSDAVKKFDRAMVALKKSGKPKAKVAPARGKAAAKGRAAPKQAADDSSDSDVMGSDSSNSSSSSDSDSE